MVSINRRDILHIGLGLLIPIYPPRIIYHNEPKEVILFGDIYYGWGCLDKRQKSEPHLVDYLTYKRLENLSTWDRRDVEKNILYYLDYKCAINSLEVSKR